MMRNLLLPTILILLTTLSALQGFTIHSNIHISKKKLLHQPSLTPSSSSSSSSQKVPRTTANTNIRSSVSEVEVEKLVNIHSSNNDDFIDIDTKTNNNSIKSQIPKLLEMTRPQNIVPVLLFHTVGLVLVSRGWFDFRMNLLSRRSALMSVCLLLASATSMVINDIHDVESGVDEWNYNNFNDDNDETMMSSSRPLVDGSVSKTVARRFLHIMYATLACCLPFVPSMLVRAAFLIQMVSCYIYTPFIKPVTFWKNAFVALLVGFSPLVSALTVVPFENAYYRVFGFSCTLTLTILAREMVMDMNDYEGDKAHNIRTLPVRCGREFASELAMGVNTLMCIVLATTSRKKIPAAIASAWSVFRMAKVRGAEGTDKQLNQMFIDDNVSMLLSITSFI